MVSFEELKLAITAQADLRAFKRASKAVREMRMESVQASNSALMMTQSMQGFGKVTAREVKSATEKMNRFKFELLGVMFFGMALQRAFGGFLSKAFDTFKTVTEGTSMSQNAMNQLRASWEFFKFSLIEGLLNNPIFQNLIAGAFVLLEQFNGLSSGTKGWIALLIVIVAIVGSLLFLWGTIGLGLQSLVLATQGWTKALVIASAVSSFLVGVLAKVKKATAAAFAAQGLKFILGWIAGILAFIVVLFLLKKKFGSFGDALKAWASAVVLAIALVVQGTVDAMQTGLNLILLGIQKVLMAAARLAGGLGFSGVEKRFRSLANTIGGLGQERVDIVGSVSSFLDGAGFNPSPVSQGSGDVNIIQNNDILVEGGENPAEQTAQQVKDNLNEDLKRAGLGEFILS